MNSFEKDFGKLMEIKIKKDKVNKDLKDLDNEMKIHCSDFVEKHNIKPKIKYLGSLELLLNKDMSAKQLIDFLNKSDE